MENGVKDELLSTLIEYYENAEQSTDDSRRLSERDRDYVDHKQFTAEEVSKLNNRKQPPIVVNRIKPKVDFLLGMERQTRSDPKAFPRTPQHEDAAEAATDGIRYVVDNVDFDYIRSDVFENMLVEGTGGAEITIKNSPRGPEIEINQYPWDRLFWDPHSRRRDFADAKYKGAVIWIDFEDAKGMGNAEAIEAAQMTGSDSDTYDDTPRIRWVDKSRNRIKICSIWFQQKGEWHWAMFTSGGFVKEPRVSPFMDEDGMPECGLELQSSFVDRDGNRYGVVRGLIDIQDEVNKRRSKALHLLTMRQTMSEQGAVDVDKAKHELARPDGHVEVQPGLNFQILDTNDLAQGQLALLQEAKGEIDAVGANAALQGKEERVMSGRALQSRQQSGAMELGPVFDSLRSWQKRVYRQIWNRIRQYWDNERWIRVTDDENNLKWVGLNRPVTAIEALLIQAGAQNLAQQDPRQLIQMGLQAGLVPPEMAQDPRLLMPVETENAVAELDVDIILEDSPDTVTLQQEQFEMLVQMYQANPQRPDNPEGVPWRMVVEASSLRNKDRVLGKDEEGEDEDPEKAALMQQIQQMEQMLQQAAQEVEQAQQQAEANSAETQVKLVESERKLQEAEIKKQTTEIKANADIITARLDAQQKAAANDETAQFNQSTTETMQQAMAEMLAQSQAMNAQSMQHVAQAVAMVGDAVSKPKDKTVTMTVNGKTYTGEVNEE